MNTNPIDENDGLLRQLAPPTDSKPEAFNLADFSPAQEGPATRAQDFIPPPREKPDPEPEPVIQEPAIDYKEQAKMLVAFVDGFQLLALPVAYQKSYFTPEELERLKDLKRRIEAQRENPETVIQEADHELYQKYLDCQDLIDKLPFTDREASLLVNPMAEVMKKYNMTPGPETLLMGALFTVMGPRLAPLLVNIKI